MASYHYHISRVSPVYLGPGPGGWHGDSLAAHAPALAALYCPMLTSLEPLPALADHVLQGSLLSAHTLHLAPQALILLRLSAHKVLL